MAGARSAQSLPPVPVQPSPATITPSQPRSVLLLQGLMGPLFRALGRGLMARGHVVHKVNFNGGDRAFWRLPGGIGGPRLPGRGDL